MPAKSKKKPSIQRYRFLAFHVVAYDATSVEEASILGAMRSAFRINMLRVSSMWASLLVMSLDIADAPALLCMRCR